VSDPGAEAEALMAKVAPPGFGTELTEWIEQRRPDLRVVRAGILPAFGAQCVITVTIGLRGES
jgi:hypothetical protein